MSQYGELIAQDAVRFERLLPGPVERVWEYLVDPGKRARWLCGGRTEQAVGGRIEMHFNNAKLSGDDDIEPPEKHRQYAGPMEFHGTVTACEPPRLLRHTWEFEGQSSEVTYELSEHGQQVKLVLTHRRLRDRSEVIDVCGGWHTHLDILKDILEKNPPRPFWKHHTANEAAYASRLAN